MRASIDGRDAGRRRRRAGGAGMRATQCEKKTRTKSIWRPLFEAKARWKVNRRLQNSPLKR